MKNFKLFTLAVGAAIMTAGITGCSTWGNSGGSERTEGRVVDDQRINASVKSNLADEPVYKFDDVDVRTFNGVVQLSGFVNSEDQKQRAGQVAQGVPGVARVVNNISLKSQLTTPTGHTNQAVYPQNTISGERNQNPAAVTP